MTTISESRQQQLSPGLAIKTPCRSASIAALVLSGEQTVDGIALVDGDRVLVKNQANSVDNGIYTVSTGAWSRAPDFDGNRDVVRGTTVRVNDGVTTAGFWRVTTADPVLIGTSALSFVEDLVGDSSTLNFLQAGSGAVARSGQSKLRDIVSVLDYGVVPDDNTARTANTTALRKLVCSVANGGDAAFQFRGTVWFPLGKTYYFDGIITLRDGIDLDLDGSTIDFSKAESTAENAAGFFYMRRDCAVRNGYINLAYTSTVGNRGNVIKLNARYADTDQAPGNYVLNNFEEDQAAGGTGTGANGTGVMAYMPGNILLQNLRIKSNNPLAAAIQMVGGLKNLTFENIEIDGQSLNNNAIDYEFGGATDEALNENEKSSHGRNFHFRNIEIKNYAAAAQDGTALGIRGAYNVIVDGLFATAVKTVLSIGTGEAANYAPGNEDIDGVKRTNYFRNIIGQQIAGTGIAIGGSTEWTGFLSPLATQAQTDVEAKTTNLLDAVVDGFSLTSSNAAGAGMSLNGNRISLRNGRIVGFSNGMFESGTRELLVDGVDIFDSAADGVRFLGAASIYAMAVITGTYAPARHIHWRGGHIAGSVGRALLFESGNANAIIEGVIFGYNNRATGRITVTGGTANPGVNKLSTLTVNGVDILNAAVDHTGNNTTTAANIAASINTKTSVPDYTAVSSGAEVLIFALAGTGTGPNGFVVARTVGGDFTTGSIKDMSGGKMELNQTNSVFVSTGMGNVIVRGCNTLAVKAGNVAYANQDSTTAQGNYLEKNIGDISSSGGWNTDNGSFVGTLTGCTTAPTGTIKYSVNGRTVTISVPDFTATSNATTKTITGMPQHLWPAAAKATVAAVSDNGGAYVFGLVNITSAGVIDARITPGGGAWTAAGVAAINGFSFSYQIN